MFVNVAWKHGVCVCVCVFKVNFCLSWYVFVFRWKWLYEKAYAGRLTLGLKAMSLRTISTVKTVVKTILRMSIT